MFVVFCKPWRESLQHPAPPATPDPLDGSVSCDIWLDGISDPVLN